MKKTILPMAVLATAAQAHAWNLEFQYGVNNPSDSLWDNAAITGMAVSFHAAPQVSLGLGVSGGTFDISGLAFTEINTTTASFDLRYDLSAGGIKPYLGFSVGNTWADTDAGDTTAFTTSANLGLAFEISSSVTLVLGAKFYRLWDVDLNGVDVGDVEGVEGFLGLRFKI